MNTESTTPQAATTAHRYAVYFAPSPGTLGWLAGSHWLGRCAAQLRPLPQLDIHGVAPADLQRLTAAPRRHGWHATLKAPFALAPGTDWLTLHHAVQQVARRLTPFTMPPMQVQRIDDFLALVPMPSHPANAAINAAAAACVTQLQPLAARPSGDELAQRRAAEEFRFHMPLTGPLSLVDEGTQALVLDAAQQFFSDLPTLQFNQLALFAEPTPGADFVLLDHLELLIRHGLLQSPDAVQLEPVEGLRHLSPSKVYE